jgi:hypothetical protein
VNFAPLCETLPLSSSVPPCEELEAGFLILEKRRLTPQLPYVILYLGGNMPVIKESADFGNSYFNISDFCHKYQEPVIITRNGENDLAVMNIGIYEKITGIRNLINLLEEADNDIENDNFLTEEEMDKKLDLL